MHLLDVRPTPDHPQLGDPVRPHPRQAGVLGLRGFPGDLLGVDADEPKGRGCRGGRRRGGQHQTGRCQACEGDPALAHPQLWTPIVTSPQLSSPHTVRPFRRTATPRRPMHRRSFGECSVLKRESLPTGASRSTRRIGLTGFEPATSPTRTERATRLRHSPNASSVAGVIALGVAILRRREALGVDPAVALLAAFVGLQRRRRRSRHDRHPAGGDTRSPSPPGRGRPRAAPRAAAAARPLRPAHLHHVAARRPAPLRGRARGQDPRRPGRPRAAAAVPRHLRPRDDRRARAACCRWRSRATTRARAASGSTTRTARASSRSTSSGRRPLTRTGPLPSSRRSVHPRAAPPLQPQGRPAPGRPRRDALRRLRRRRRRRRPGRERPEPRPDARQADPHRPEAGRRLPIPPDNPFRNRAGALPEIYAYGVRNPYRFSFDRRTGSLTIGDVGQDEIEEIDFIHGRSGGRQPRGGYNFGWDSFEGRNRYEAGRAPGAHPPGAPAHALAGFCSITGGYVIRDRSLGRGWIGQYVYGDLCDGTLRLSRLRRPSARSHPTRMKVRRSCRSARTAAGACTRCRWTGRSTGSAAANPQGVRPLEGL